MSAPDSRPPCRPRVLQCITRLGLGGAEQVALSIMRALRGEVDFAVFTVHGQSGDDVGREMEPELRSLGIPWFHGTRVPMKWGGPLRGAWALGRAVRAFRPDALHCHAEPAEACVAVWSAARAERTSPVVVRTVHNSMFWRFWPRVGRWCDRRLPGPWVAGVSAAACAEFARYRLDSGAPPATPRLIYNGVSLAARPPHGAPHELRRRRVLFAGRFEPEKGPDILCQALPLVRLPPGVSGELQFVGHGCLEAEVRALAAQPPPGWAVNVGPPVRGLPAAMAAFDVLVAPSRFEGLGLVAIEATLCGLPVVASTAQGLREALPADHPWLAEPGDAAGFAARLSAALSAPETWAPAVHRGQRFAAERFAPTRMADGYQRLYRDALSGAA